MGIPWRLKGRTGSCIWIDEHNFVGPQGIDATLISNFIWKPQIESKPRSTYLNLTSSERQQAEADVAMTDILKQSPVVSEAINMDQISSLNEIAKEGGSCDFRGNSWR